MMLLNLGVTLFLCFPFFYLRTSEHTSHRTAPSFCWQFAAVVSAWIQNRPTAEQVAQKPQATSPDRDEGILQKYWFGAHE